MNERSLSQWLDYIETLHPAAIDMGLARVTRVAEALGFAPPDHAPAPVSVIVAGTNGKGSTSVFTEALLLERGQRVGTTLSPHVHEFNERVRIDGVAADDALLCDAFAEVDAARGSVALTYFEFAALVALCCFRRAAVDVAILEVGLGGRLDAFNLVGANLAVVTSIGLDHQAFLGDDLEQIGREKAAVMRAGRSAVVGSDVTASVLQHAQAEGCPVRQLGRDFCVRLEPGSWHFEAPQEGLRFENLPWGPLAPENCALGIAAAARLGPVDEAMVRAALARATLPGRCEIWRLGDHDLIVDVAHNPAGAAFLARQLALRQPGRRFVAVLGMLADKDAEGVVNALQHCVRHWVCTGTRGPRGQGAAALRDRLPVTVSTGVAADARQALEQARSLCGPRDAILAFGSFDLVEQVRNSLSEMHAPIAVAVGPRPEGAGAPASGGCG